MEHQDIKNAFANQKVQYLNAEAVCSVRDPERRYRLFMGNIKSRDKFVESELRRIDKLKDTREKNREMSQLLQEASYGCFATNLEKARQDLLDDIANMQISFRQIAKRYNCDNTIFSAKKGTGTPYGKLPPISVLQRLGYDKSAINESVNEILLGEKLPVTLPHKLDLAVAHFERLASENNIANVEMLKRQHIGPLYDIYAEARLKFAKSNIKRIDAIRDIVHQFAVDNVDTQNGDMDQAVIELEKAAFDPINTKYLLDERINELRENEFREYGNSAPYNVSMRVKVGFQRVEECGYSTRGIRNTTFMMLRIETGQPIDYFAAEDYTQQCDLQYTDCDGKKQLVKSEITKRLVSFWLGMHPDDQNQVILDWTQNAMRSLYSLK